VPVHPVSAMRRGPNRPAGPPAVRRDHTEGLQLQGSGGRPGGEAPLELGDPRLQLTAARARPPPRPPPPGLPPGLLVLPPRGSSPARRRPDSGPSSSARGRG